MDKIGKYENLVEIGRGGMGVVYKAYDPFFQEMVAVKTMSAELSTDVKFREKFLGEGRSIRKLRHENIIEVKDLSEDEGRPYLVMELLEGSNLKDRMYGRERVPLELRLRIMMDVCKGLSYAHESGIIHRDIKPENIFITKSEHVKILDFGLARAIAAATRSSKIMGTINYMSPEHWQKKEDRRSDIFAAGAVFYELLTLKKAFDGDNPIEVMRKILQVDPEPIEKTNPTIPARLSTVILKALSKNPDQRYQKIDALLRELEDFAKFLDERKRAVQGQAVEAIEQLAKLIVENEDLLTIDELGRVKQNWPFILRQAGIVEEDEAPTVYQPQEFYLELVEQYEKARSEYELLSALVQKRRRISPLLDEAVALKNAREFEGARQVLQKILQDDPGNTQAASLYQDISAQIAEQRLQAERAGQAAELFQRAASISSCSELSVCLDLLDEVLRLQPGHEAASALRVKVQARIRDQAELEEKCRRVEEVLDAARQALAAGDFERAREGVESALAVDPEGPGITELRDQVQRAEEEFRVREDRERQVRKLNEEALAFDEEGNEDKAMARVSELLALEPAHQPGLELKRKIETRRQLRERSKEIFEKSKAKYLSEDFRESLRLLNEALKLDPGHQDAIALRAEAQQVLKERAALREKRRQAEAVLTAVRSALKREDVEQARQMLERARSLCPESPRILEIQNEIDQVMEAIESRRERERQVGRLFEEARSLDEADEEEIALTQLNELLALEPAHLAALRLKREIESRRQARERGEALFQKAKAKFSSNDLSDCLRLLDDVLRLQPGHLGAMTLREDTLERVKEQAQEEMRRQGEEALSAAQKALRAGDLERAREQIEQARALYREAPRIPELLKEIDQAEEKLRATQEREQRLIKLFQEAQSLDGAGEEEVALSRLNDLLDLEPAHVAALMLKRKIEGQRQERERAARGRAEKIAAAYRSACETEVEGNLERAWELARAILAEEATHTGARELLERVEAGLRERKRTEEQKRERVAQLLEAARQGLSTKRLTDAMDTLDQIERLEPGCPDVVELRRQIHVELEAEKTRQARHAQGEREKQLGLRLLKAKRYEESLAVLQRAQELSDADITIREGIAEAKAVIRAEELRVKIQAGIVETRKLLASEDFDAARAKVQWVLEVDPKNPLAEDFLSRIDQAQEEKRRRSEIARLLAQSAEALVRQDFKEAVTRAREALFQDSQNDDAKTLLKQIEDAQKETGRRERIAALYTQGQQAFIRENFDEAGSRLQELLILDPQHPDAKELRRRIDQAQAEKSREARVAALLVQSQQALNRKEFQEAALRVHEVLSLDPKNRPADDLLNRISDAEKEQRRNEEVFKLLSQSRHACMRREFDEGARLAQEVRRFDPRNNEAKYLLKQIEKEKKKAQGKRPLSQTIIASGIGVIVAAVLGHLIIRPLLIGTGEILILSEPADASILLNGETKGMTSSGKLQLSEIKPGTYTLIARKDGYVDRIEQITIRKGINPDKRMALRAALAVLVVRTNQPGARIFLDGKDTGVVTASQGSSVIPTVSPGQHSLLLSKEGFVDWKETHEFSADRTTEINAVLKPIEIPRDLALLRITSDPPDANVVVESADGSQKGITSGGSLTLQDLKPGILRVVVEKDGYAAKQASISLAAGQVANRHFALSIKPALLQLTTTPAVANAVVKVNDVEIGKTDASGGLKRNVAPGKNQVLAVIAENYEKDLKTIELKPGKTMAVTIALTRSPRTMAMLSVSSIPSAAEVYIDEKRVGITPTGTIQVIPGRHKITVKKETYRVKEETLELRGGEPKPLSYKLEKGLGRLEIVTEPQGSITATIDGQSYNLEPEKAIVLDPGEYTVLLTRRDYTNQQQKVIIRDQETTQLRVKLDRVPVSTATLSGPFTDNFRNLNNWENLAGWRGNGTLSAKGAGAIFSKGRVFRDFIERFQIRLRNSAAASFVVRAQDPKNLYLIQITGDAYWDSGKRNYISFYVQRDGNENQIGAVRLPFESGRMKDWFTITINANDNRFTVTASGISGTTARELELGTFTDPEDTYPEGKIGFRVSRSEEFQIRALVVVVMSSVSSK